MQDFSNLTFKYGNKKYCFTAELFTLIAGEKQTNYVLNNENILSFEYTNALNQLVMDGTLTYLDKYGVIDKYIEKQFAYCQINFNLVDEKYDNQIVVEKLSEDEKFVHTFYMTGIQVLDRKHSEITYKIDLVSVNWFKCISNLSFSNYSSEPQQIFDVIKSMLTLNQLNIDQESFDKVKSSVKINYVTNGNDNTFTTVKYLLDKMYYYNEKDKELKFLLYNEHTDKFQLFDLIDKKLATGMYITVVSFFKSTSEEITQPEQNQLATVVSLPKTDTMQSLFKYNVFDFSYDYNRVDKSQIEPKTIVNVLNSRFIDSTYDKKYEDWFDTTLKFERSGSYWNNDFSLYGDCFEILNKDNALVINTAAEILRQPGSFMNISVDRSVSYAESEDPTKFEEVKNKYKNYEGAWFIAKVRHLVSPAAQTYRQNVVLFRNFKSL